jgi:hypothetical protein
MRPIKIERLARDEDRLLRALKDAEGDLRAPADELERAELIRDISRRLEQIRRTMFTEALQLSDPSKIKA